MPELIKAMRRNWRQFSSSRQQLLFHNEFLENEDFPSAERDFYVTTETRSSFHTGPFGYWYASKVSGSISVLYPGFSGSR
jgi:hypothetical protein